MPVSYLPCFTTLCLLLIPVVGRAKGGRKGLVVGLAISGFSVLVIGLSVYVPGCVLFFKAKSGDAASQYKYARWTETHCEELQNILFWPCSPDLLGGFAWLEKAAAQDYLPAVYLVGLRLKYGDFVPKPQEWDGPGGNVFPQPERGQKMIDRALKMGFKPPPGDERSYYINEFRRNDQTP